MMNATILASALFEGFELPADVSVETFLLTLGLMGIVMLGMAVGVIFQGKELKGSCGGKGGADDCFCDANNLPRACEQLGEAHDH